MVLMLPQKLGRGESGSKQLGDKQILELTRVA